MLTHTQTLLAHNHTHIRAHMTNAAMLYVHHYGANYLCAADPFGDCIVALWVYATGSNVPNTYSNKTSYNMI